MAKRKHLFLAALMSTAILLAAGFILIKNGGYPNRLTPEERLIFNAMTDTNPRTDECFTRSSISINRDEKPCLLGMQDASHVDFVLWGDSHANALMPAFDEFGRQTNRTGIFFGAPGCFPFLTDKPLIKDPQCIEQNKEAAEYISAHPSVVVFIASEWYERYKFSDYTEGSDRFSTLAPLLYETLTKLPSDTKIIIFGRFQTFEGDLPRSMLFKLMNGEQFQPFMPREIWDGDLARFDAGILQVAPLFKNVRLINPDDGFCKGDACYIMDDKGFYYSDTSHISTYGAIHNILPLLLGKDPSAQ